MKPAKQTLIRAAGQGASALMIFFAVFWAYWGTAEMYHEGWWGAWYNRLPYLAPLALILIPTLIVFRWPIAGGVLILAIGGFALFFFNSDVAYIGLSIALLGGVFIASGVIQRKSTPPAAPEPAPWWRRQLRYLLAAGAPVLVCLIISAVRLPVVLTRVDDGERGARQISGNGVALVWAPEGPGWNWKQPWGGYPAWQNIALYGVPPPGLAGKPGYGRQPSGKTVYAGAAEMVRTDLCRYLNAGGTTLSDTPQNIWRMPTVDEIVRSLGRHGVNAGCAWQGELGRQVQCAIEPDKESPLWATDHPAIYYWAADDYHDSLGYFVAYNGTVNVSNKLGGNPRHSYRCVRQP